MSRGPDHIVHAVRDLDAAADFYRRIGFTVGARNRHSWGTHNCIVQFPGFFIEILTLAEPEKLGDDGISRLFGRFNGDFLKAHEGFSQLVLESRDAVADEKAFREQGIAASERHAVRARRKAPGRLDREARLLTRLCARSAGACRPAFSFASIIFRRISGIRHFKNMPMA